MQDTRGKGQSRDRSEQRGPMRTRREAIHPGQKAMLHQSLQSFPLNVFIALSIGQCFLAIFFISTPIRERNEVKFKLSLVREIKH